MSATPLFFDQFHNRLAIRGRLVAKTGLRIGVGRSTSPVASDLPVIRDALNRPFIPGASFKGVLRSSVESWLRAVAGPKVGACYPVGDEAGWCIDDVKALKRQYEKDEALANQLWQRSCLACRTFGAQWLASHIYISDLPVDSTLWAGQYEVRNGVSLDRDTETAKEGLLYEFETVPAGTTFLCQIEAENMAEWQLGLLLLALRPFERGETTLGGGASRGLGRVELTAVETTYVSLTDDPVGQMIAYLEQGARGQTVTATQRTAWQTALHDELTNTRQSAVSKEDQHV